MAGDWLKLYRRLADSELWLREPFSRGQAWVDLLMLARWKAGFVRIRGVKVNLLPGQLAWSDRALAQRWQWNRRKVRRFLSVLEADSQITQQKNNVTTVISIKNWERYQGEYTADCTTECTTECTTDFHNSLKTEKNESPKKGKKGKKGKSTEVPYSFEGAKVRSAFGEAEEGPEGNGSKAPAKRPKPSLEESYPRLCEISRSFLQGQQKQHPSKIKSIPEKKVRAGADTLRLLTERDGFDLEGEVIPTLRWAIRDEFWSDKLLNLSSLRKVGSNGEMKFVNIMASCERAGKPSRMGARTTASFQPQSFSQKRQADREAMAAALNRSDEQGGEDGERDHNQEGTDGPGGRLSLLGDWAGAGPATQEGLE